MMTEKRRTTQSPAGRSQQSDDQSQSPAEGRPRRPRRLSQVIASARQEFEMLTGRAVDGVSAVHRSEDGWTICLEVVELERVPASTSVLGSYEVVADVDGAVVEYERTQRYYRNQASDGDS